LIAAILLRMILVSFWHQFFFLSLFFNFRNLLFFLIFFVIFFYLGCPKIRIFLHCNWQEYPFFIRRFLVIILPPENVPPDSSYFVCSKGPKNLRRPDLVSFFFVIFYNLRILRTLPVIFGRAELFFIDSPFPFYFSILFFYSGS